MLYHYPHTAKVNKPIAKNKFYQQGNANQRVERLFARQVESIRWAYKLSAQTINLADSDSVKEIQIFEIVSRVPELDKEILQFIDKSIPSPIVFEIHYQDKVQVIATYKRQSQSDSQKVVLGKYYASDWQDRNERQDLPLVFGIADLYERMIETLLPTVDGIHHAVFGDSLPNSLPNSSPTPSPNSPNHATIPITHPNAISATIEQKIALAEKVALLTKQINELQKRIYKEKQFNRQVELNLQLQGLQKQLSQLIS